MVESEKTKHTCLRLEISGADPIFVKGTWYHSRFDISVTDGSSSWICNATEEDVAERAAQWDQPVSEYLELAEQYLGFQQPDSVYGFSDALEGSKRLSWTFEKEGTKLEWRWKCKPSHDNKKITVGVLDFLMEANIRLSEEVVNKTRSFEKMKSEAERCLAQGEKLCKEKTEFEDATYAKFLSVLNAKKAKLRALRDKEDSGKAAEEEESTDKTESFDDSGRNDNEQSEEVASKKATGSKARGQKRAARS
ncbi:PREDICTED: DNA repair protein XRCC4 [Camelina sativa]|uniref:DNA repair protein XRCC4 n=1 Tax=Camelina sativa TaxID=90675 RepID=A0ABM0Z8W1_CAMSA|nr:PREDICTED: DNA repair protein XRCC4 [Camelina sativa]